MSETDGYLENGWSSRTPVGDTLANAAAGALASRLRQVAAAMDAKLIDDQDLVATHFGLPDPLGNSAVLLCRPGSAGEAHEQATRILDFYGAESPFAVFTPFGWPIHEPGTFLFGHPPLMIRPSGERPATYASPPELHIDVVSDAEALSDWERVFVEGFPLGAMLPFEASRIVDGRVLGGATRFYLGRVDGQPVCCSAAHVDHGVVEIDFVTTMPGRRGRGYGEAITWAATHAEPALPAVLLASDHGRPVYERMGYLAVDRWTLWGRA